MTDTPKLHLKLLESTQSIIDELVQKSEDEFASFDKVEKKIPDLRQSFKDVQEAIK
jgi:hypothetical protein